MAGACADRVEALGGPELRYRSVPRQYRWGGCEFVDDNQVNVNNNRFDNDLSGSRGELGLGVAVSMTDRLQLHADFDYANGEKIEQPWGANVGLHYSW